MSKVAKLVGIEARDYTDREGQQRRFCNLHLCYLEGTVPGIKGSMVEALRCPRGVDDRTLKIGQTYELVERSYHTKDQEGRPIQAQYVADLQEVSK